MELEARMAQLERQLAWSRRLMVLAGLAVAVLLTVGAGSPVPDSLQARRFEVVNAEGNVVAILGVTGRHGFLEITTGDGVPIFDLIAHPDVEEYGMFSIRNWSGREIVNVRSGMAGEGMLSVRNHRGFDNVIIRGSNDSKSGGEVTVLNAQRDARRVAALRVDAGGSGEVTACPRDGQNCRMLIPAH